MGLYGLPVVFAETAHRVPVPTILLVLEEAWSWVEEPLFLVLEEAGEPLFLVLEEEARLLEEVRHSNMCAGHSHLFHFLLQPVEQKVRCTCPVLQPALTSVESSQTIKFTPVATTVRVGAGASEIFGWIGFKTNVFQKRCAVNVSDIIMLILKQTQLFPLL